MKNIILLFTTLFLINTFSFAQDDIFLIAQNKGRNIYFNNNQSVKITYKDDNVTKEFRGRIDELKETSVVLRGFNKNVETIEIPLSDLTSIKKIHKTGRIITGVIGSLGMALGIVLIAEDQRERGEYMDGLITAFGAIIMVSSSIPYILVAATPGNHTTEEGFRFFVAKRKN